MWNKYFLSPVRTLHKMKHSIVIVAMSLYKQTKHEKYVRKMALFKISVNFSSSKFTHFNFNITNDICIQLLSTCLWLNHEYQQLFVATNEKKWKKWNISPGFIQLVNIPCLILLLPVLRFSHLSFFLSFSFHSSVRIIVTCRHMPTTHRKENSNETN